MDSFWTKNGHASTLERHDLLLEVKHALVNLYDPIYLQNSVLIALLREASVQIVPGQEAKALRKVLVEAMDDLRPGGNTPLRSAGHRSYAALRGRYVDQLEIEELASNLGIGERQLRRELRSGLEAVAAAVARRLQRQPALDPPVAVPLAETRPVQAEIEALDSRQGPVNLCTEVRNVQALVASLARDRDSTMHDRVEPESVVVRTDRVVLRQALLALYSWAITRQRGQVFEARVSETGDNEAVFELACLGSGGQPNGKSELPVLDELLQALQGRLEIASVPDGQAVRLFLPCAPLLTLLLIDDNRGFHQLFQRYLSGLPVRVLGAYNASGGLALARSERPRVIILDIMIPDQDGWELLAMIQADESTRDIPVIICSVLAQEALARSLAVAGYIRKPVTQAMLLSALRGLNLGDL